MTREGLARLAFEAHYDADHPAGGGWDRWSEMIPDGIERAKWHAVGARIEELIASARTSDDEDAPGTGAPKVIIVTETPAGAQAAPVERRYDANQWDDSGDRLVILRHGRPVASYQPNAWLSVREDDSAEAGA